ncbi:MAG: hypothetical protein EZS28_048134 [Streblomastix strix]|uniref:Protein kinase domain-containing protein n=1 Tax=Streblomastix strix TaxID=222440 RepID=A0A5J4TDZ2_9EUKA|nr:MAG: hypothetical protein EZS28_048134 [Streblomastix strix]
MILDLEILVLLLVDFHGSGCAFNPNFHPSDYRCFIKKDRYYALDYGLACMISIPLTSDEKNRTINLLLEYFNNYAYIDTSLNPQGSPIGYGKHPINVILILMR